jgi:hypothetical protein
MMWFSIYSFGLLSVMCCYGIICYKPKHEKNSIFECCWYNECPTLNVGCIFWRLHSKLNGSYDVVGSGYKYIHYDLIVVVGYMIISLTIGSSFVTIFSSIECWVFCKDCEFQVTFINKFEKGDSKFALKVGAIIVIELIH